MLNVVLLLHRFTFYVDLLRLCCLGILFLVIANFIFIGK